MRLRQSGSSRVAHEQWGLRRRQWLWWWRRGRIDLQNFGSLPLGDFVDFFFFLCCVVLLKPCGRSFSLFLFSILFLFWGFEVKVVRMCVWCVPPLEEHTTLHRSAEASTERSPPLCKARKGPVSEWKWNRKRSHSTGRGMRTEKGVGREFFGLSVGTRG